MEKVLAVDLCDTLYKSNTTQDFFNYVFAKDDVYKKLKRKNSSLSFKVVNKVSNKFFKRDMSRILMTKILNKKSLEEINSLVEAFIINYLEPLKIEKVHKIISEYKEQGYKVVIISASYDFIAKGVAMKLGFADYITSKAEVLENEFTGRVASDILYTKFDVFTEKYDINDNLVMITDNITDYDFVKRIKKSYIVINSRNKAFWTQRKEDRFIFVED